MSRRGPKPTYYVCNGLIGDNLISKQIEAATSEDANKIYEKIFGIKPQTLFGPFFKKRVNAIDNIKAIKFSNRSFRALYNGWEVVAIELKDPKNSAYLLFDKRIDSKKMSKPTGTFIVNIDELRVK